MASTVRRPNGPGLLAAASNNDPTTVATLAVVGATSGFALCWLVVLLVPALALVQSLAADVGAVAKTSLQGAIRREYGLGWALAVLTALVAVNALTLAADLKAGSEALALLTDVPTTIFIVPFAVVVGWLLLSKSYRRIERYLSFVALFFVLYVASALLSHLDAGALLQAIVNPQFPTFGAMATGAIALVGTTLTGYAYVWESIGVAERGLGRVSIRSFERDAAGGMLIIGFIFVAILVASAATLGREHLAVETATDMAVALRPLAGPWAADLFALGLLASAILAVPILAGVNGYIVAHTFGWSGSLDTRFDEARAFYGVMIGSLGVAAAFAFVPVPAVALLFWSSVAAGIATPLSLTFLMLAAGNVTLMGEHRMNRTCSVCGWGITAIVTGAVGAFLALRL